MQGNDALSGAKGAYVNIILRVTSEKEFLEVAKEQFLKLGFYIVNVEDIEPFNLRASKYQLRDELFNLADEVVRTGEMGIDTFHTYATDETLN